MTYGVGGVCGRRLGHLCPVTDDVTFNVELLQIYLALITNDCSAYVAGTSLRRCSLRKEVCSLFLRLLLQMFYSLCCGEVLKDVLSRGAHSSRS